MRNTITAPITVEIKLYKKSEFEANNPKPIPVFHVKSKFKYLFM